MLQPSIVLTGKQLHKLSTPFQNRFELPRFLSQLTALATFEAIARNYSFPLNRSRAC